MPTDDKTKKLRIKVEEVAKPKDETETQTESVITKEKVPEGSESKSEILVPKVSSFSQLDAPIDNQKTQEETISEKVTQATQPKYLETTQKNTTPETKESQTPKPPLTSEEVREWLKEVRPDTTKELEKSSGFDPKIILVLMALFAILGAFIGGILYYTKGVQKKTPPQTSQEIQSPTPTILITETPELIDFTKFSLRILNGSGKAGEAKKVKDILIKEGFKEDNVQTGNADSYNYKQTLVSLKKEVSEEVLEKIKQSLSEYDVVKSDKEPEDPSFDIVIIVGATKK